MAIVALTVGKQLGCGLAFLIGRWVTSPELRAACCLPRDRRHHDPHQPQPQPQQEAERESQRSRTVRAMFLALEHHPWQIGFLIRLLPIPISIKNYGLACLPASACPFHVFMLTTFVAGVPFTVAWVYLGESARSLLEALQGKGEGLTRHGAYAQELSFLLVGLAVAIALVLLLRRYTRKYSRLLAEREAAAEAEAAAKASLAAAAAAATGAGSGPRVAETPARGVSSASSTTTLMTLLTDDEAAATTEEGGEEGEADTVDVLGAGGAWQRQRERRRRRRRSSESTCSSLSLAEEGEAAAGNGDTAV